MGETLAAALPPLAAPENNCNAPFTWNLLRLVAPTQPRSATRARTAAMGETLAAALPPPAVPENNLTAPFTSNLLRLVAATQPRSGMLAQASGIAPWPWA